MELSTNVKKCTKCREYKSEDLFPPKLDPKTGLVVAEIGNWCSDCIITYRKQYGKSGTGSVGKYGIRKWGEQSKDFERRAGEKEALELRKNPTEFDLRVRSIMIPTTFKTIFKYVVSNAWDRVILDVYVPLSHSKYRGIGIIRSEKNNRIDSICECDRVKVMYMNDENDLYQYIDKLSKCSFVGKRTVLA